MKHLATALVIFSLLNSSCNRTEEVNYVSGDLAGIANKINGVWVKVGDHGDSTLFYLEKGSDVNNIYEGVVSQHFTLSDSGFFISRLHEPTIKLYKDGKRTMIKTIHSLSEEKEVEIKIINDKILTLDGVVEYRKVKSLE